MWVQVPFLAPAGMAELVDALDSGSSEGSFMKVQVLLPAPSRRNSKCCSFLFCALSSNAVDAIQKRDMSVSCLSFFVFFMKAVGIEDGIPRKSTPYRNTLRSPIQDRAKRLNDQMPTAAQSEYEGPTISSNAPPRIP